MGPGGTLIQIYIKCNDVVNQYIYIYYIYSCDADIVVCMQNSRVDMKKMFHMPQQALTTIYIYYSLDLQLNCRVIIIGTRYFRLIQQGKAVRPLQVLGRHPLRVTLYFLQFRFGTIYKQKTCISMVGKQNFTS